MCVCVCVCVCVCFVDRCLSFCNFSFGHYVVCSSSIYGFWLPLWYHQNLLINDKACNRTKYTVKYNKYIKINLILLRYLMISVLCLPDTNCWNLINWGVLMLDISDPITDNIFGLGCDWKFCSGFQKCVVRNNWISTFLLISLSQYLCWWTISPRWHYPHSCRCFGTDLIY